MKKIGMSALIYTSVMIVLYFLKDTIIPACDTYNSLINIGIFLLHLVTIFSSILLVRKEVSNVNARFIANSGIAVFYLLMLYIFLKFETFLVICSI
jgi:hypothetical protein